MSIAKRVLLTRLILVLLITFSLLANVELTHSIIPVHAQQPCTTIVTDATDVAFGGSATDGQLRYALGCAQAQPGSTITFSPTLSNPCSQDGISYTICITLQAPLTVTVNPLTIDGTSQRRVMLLGGSQTTGNPSNKPIFKVQQPAALVLKNLTIAFGNSLNDGGLISNYSFLEIDNSILEYGVADVGVGGAIYNAPNATLTINNGDIHDNASYGNPSSLIPGDGGAIYNDQSTVTINSTTFRSNISHAEANLPPPLPAYAPGGGGAIFNHSGRLTISNSTFEYNEAFSTSEVDGYGGAIANSGPNTFGVFILASTFHDNTAIDEGGAIFSGETQKDFSVSSVTIVNSTIANNTAYNDGGGIIAWAGASISLNSITVANNQGLGRVRTGIANISSDQLAKIGGVGTLIYGVGSNYGADDCSNPLGNQGYDLEGPASWQSTKCGIPQSQKFTLKNLGNYGGPTWTMPPSYVQGGPVGSNPTVDVIPSANCPTSVDQRDVARAVFPDLHCDIGAYEVTLNQQGIDTFPNIVNTLDDQDLGNCTNNVPNAHCSLREAVKYSPPGSTITFAPGVTGTIHLTGGEIPITFGSLTIIGPSVYPGITIDGGQSSRIFHVAHNIYSYDGGAVTFQNLTLTNGNAGQTNTGGAILSEGYPVHIFNSTFYNNWAGAGAAIFCTVCNGVPASLIVNSTVYDNLATGDQYNHPGVGVGGAIGVYGGAVTIVDSTLADNVTSLANSGTTLFLSVASAYLYDTILASNMFNAPGCAGNVVDGGGNLLAGFLVGQSCGTTIPIDQNDPLNDSGLPPPTYYGGPTPLISISTSSQAAANGNVSNCYTALGSGNPNCAIDQRGLARLVGSNYSSGSYSVEVLGAKHLDTIGIYRPSAALFALRLSNTTGNADIVIPFGNGSQPAPVVGDWGGLGYDGTGLLNRANGQFLLSNTDNGINENFVFGNPGDEPIAGHWTQTAPTFGIGVFRASNGLLLLKNTPTTGYADYVMVLGIPGDQGLADDWNGDTVDSPGVYRPSSQLFLLTNQVCNCSVTAVDYAAQLGNPGDVPFTGDWVNQGTAGIGVFRPTNGLLLLRNELTTGFAETVITYGIPNDVPVAGHWELNYPGAPSKIVAPPNVLVPPSTSVPLIPPTPIQSNLGG